MTCRDSDALIVVSLYFDAAIASRIYANVSSFRFDPDKESNGNSLYRFAEYKCHATTSTFLCRDLQMTGGA